jgi:peptidyl-prolyl cis-trans isomerase C
MLKISRFAALAMLGAIVVSPVYAEDKPAAVVNGVAIPEQRLDLRVKIVTSQGQPDTPELRKAVREDLVSVEIMTQEAVKKGLDKQAEVAQQLELAKQSVLVSAYVQDYLKSHPVSDQAVSDEYNKWKASLGDKELHVRHILVDSEQEAKEIAARLKKGGKNNTFEKLAQKSKDAGSREHGGELGWVPVGKISETFVKPFAEALTGLKKGEVSEPVESKFGWHIIEIEDERDLKAPTLEEMKPQITQRLQQREVKDMVADLRSKAKIEE